MRRTGKIVSVEGKIAKVLVERSTMCDGCEKQGCDGTCTAGSLAGAGKSMTADAVNEIGATVGDTVEVETSDGKVLSYAALVFILPIVILAIFYIVAKHFSGSEKVAIGAAALGFVISFVIIGMIEKSHRKKLPDITVTRIVGRSGASETDNK